MDRIRFWRHSSPLVGVSSNDMPTVFETVINGEPLDWLWSQAGGHDAYGSTPERDSVDWMAVLDSEVAGDGYSLMRAGTEPRRIPVLQVLMRGARVGTVTVSVSERRRVACRGPSSKRMMAALSTWVLSCSTREVSPGPG